MAGAKKSRKAGNTHPIVVIGGGPAGMTAAQTAVKNYKNVVLFDKNPQPGKKLLSVPGGPLYVAEELSLEKTVGAFGTRGNFVRPALKAFGWKNVSAHLASMDIKISSNGNSHLAVPVEISSELSVHLKKAAESEGVLVRKSSRVSDVLFSEGAATGVVVNAVEYPASAVIIACGSFSSPASGSTRDGYEFAKKAGHTVQPLRPALVGLETVEKYGRKLADAEFNDCKMDVFLDGKLQLTDRGHVKFTTYGLEGDLVLTHSAAMIEMLAKGTPEIHIDMIPDMSRKELEGWLIAETESNEKGTVGDVLAKYIPEKLRNVMGKIMRIHSEKPIGNLSYLERKSLFLWVKDFHVAVKRPRPFNETRGVIGGVSTDEIDPETMRSRKIKNLYFAGEVMDLLGPWGGFNIQMAFATGFLAGLSAARSLAR